MTSVMDREAYLPQSFEEKRLFLLCPPDFFERQLLLAKLFASCTTSQCFSFFKSFLGGISS